MFARRVDLPPVIMAEINDAPIDNVKIFLQIHLSTPNKQHKKYPYLLQNVSPENTNHVWATDITYIKVNGAFVYLTAILDLFSRKVLAWTLSNTLDVQFCLAALNEAFALYGTPEIFNTDQGSQYTSDKHVQALLDKGVKVSMDGKGRATDNAQVERLWRTVKYEDIFIRDYSSVKELRSGLNKFFRYYNTKRIHQAKTLRLKRSRLHVSISRINRRNLWVWECYLCGSLRNPKRRSHGRSRNDFRHHSRRLLPNFLPKRLSWNKPGSLPFQRRQANPHQARTSIRTNKLCQHLDEKHSGPTRNVKNITSARKGVDAYDLSNIKTFDY